MIFDSKGRKIKRKMGFVKGYEPEPPEPTGEPADLRSDATLQPETTDETEEPESE